MIEREGIFTNKDTEPTKDDLSAINLTADQMRLIKDIIESEPRFYSYLKSPFLVKTLFEVGAVEECEFVREKIHEANYKKFHRGSIKSYGETSTFKIAILPSMSKEFYFGDDYQSLSENGFKPTETFNKIVLKLKNEILNKTKLIMLEKIYGDQGIIAGKNTDACEELAERIVKDRISFFIEDARPLVIHPFNANEAIYNICPEADLSIILLDKDVYLSIYFDEKSDIYPSVNWFYMDIHDIKYSRVGEEIDQISKFLASKLKEDLNNTIISSP